jgi:hypothetical protein
MNTVDRLICRYKKLDQDRVTQLSNWQEVAEYFQPERASFFGSMPVTQTERSKIFDSTPEDALQTLAAALQTLLTSPVHAWFSLGLVLGSEDASREVKEWLESVQKLMIAKFNSEEGGFHSSVHEFWLDLPSFGTSPFFVDEHEGIRFTCIPLSEVRVSENAKGVIDTVYREFTMTARQIAERWPKGYSKAIETALEEGKDPDRKFKVVHAIEPRDGYVIGSKKSKELPFASYYFELDSRKLLSESGYHEMPMMVARWSKTAGQVYGRGPGQKALPDCRVLNEMSR